MLIRLLLPITFQSPVYIKDIIKNYGEESPKASDSFADMSAADNYNLEASYDNNAISSEVTPADEIVIPKNTTQNTLKTFFSKINWIKTLFSIWFLGALIFLSHSLLRMYLFKKKIFLSGKCTHKQSIELIKKYKQMLNIEKIISIRECAYIQTPVITGVIRPNLLMPKGFLKNMDDNSLSMIILHEMCHIKSSDILKNNLWLIAKALNWYNPLVWISYQAFLDDMEKNCDQMVLSYLENGKKANYFDALMKVVKLSKYKNTAPPLLCFCKDKSKLRKKVDIMINPQRTYKSINIFVSIILIIAVFTCFTTACTGTATDSPGSTPVTEFTEDETTAFDAIDSSSFDLPMTLLEDDDLSVVLKSVEAVNSQYIEMLFEVENKTNDMYQLDISQLCVNNFMLSRKELNDYNGDFEISQNTVKEFRFKINYETLKSSYSIENITDINFYFRIVDINQYETKYEDIAYLSNGVEQENMDITTEYLVVSDEYLDVYFVDAYKEDQVEYYEIVIYNKSENILGVTANSVAINDISIITSLGTFIMPNSYYMFKGSVSTMKTSFLTEYDSAASIQIELYCYNVDNGSILSSLNGKLILDENTNVEKQPIKGQIFYDKDDVLISVEKIFEEDNIRWLKMYVENKNDRAAQINITNMYLNEHIVGRHTFFSVLPGTYSTQIIDVYDTFPNEEYKVIMDYYFSIGFNETMHEESLTFTLEK